MFLSGYRAILAEPKNKSSESLEHDYYSNNTRQEPRGNTFPFCKSQLFILEMICSLQYNHKVRKPFGRREANKGLGYHLNSKLDTGGRNESVVMLLNFHGYLLFYDLHW